MFNKKRYRTKFIQKDNDGNIFCYKCMEYKEPNEFDISSQESDIFYRDGRDRRCKKCKSIAFRRRLNERAKNNTIERTLNERFLGLRDRNKRLNSELDFGFNYLIELWNYQEGKCAISKIPMTYVTRNGRVFTNVSIDRINPNIGYKIGNIQLVCMAVNQMKSDMTMDELYYFCENILKHRQNG